MIPTPFKPFCIIFLLFSSTIIYSQPTETQYLSGHGTKDAVEWDFFCTAGRNSGKWTRIPVPSHWEFHGFGQFNYGHDREEARLNETGMYRYRFAVPAAWKGRKVNIVFDGSMTDTEVKINGKSAGERHQGAYYRFRYDVSKLLKYGGKNLLEVTVHKASANSSVEAAERHADFWIYGGIFRPVWLEALPAEHIERVAIDARMNGDFAMDVFLGKTLDAGEIHAQVKTLDGKPFGNKIIQKTTVGDSIRLCGRFSNPELWSAEFPNRYMVEITLLKAGKPVHRIVEKFGFRTAELHAGDGFYVNGCKIRFKGVNRHTHWPTSGRAINYDIALDDARLIKDMNMNAVRMSHYPPDAYFLDICDSLGLYVIDELTAWQYPPYETQVGRKLVRELITRDVNHPSIVMWANGNEGGNNFELLPSFARYDIQKRLVIHPWLDEKDVNTYHYISWGIGADFCFGGHKVFFPTEMIHGLYDGGHGAGLDDYWNLMLQTPVSAGGFLWDFVDQGIVRADKHDSIDTDTNHAADGIVGPFREKEGSYFTIKEIWSPIVPEMPEFLPKEFDGKIKIHNRYDFTNLKGCRFAWRWIGFDYEKDQMRFIDDIDTGNDTPFSGDIKPGSSGWLQVFVPDNWRDYDMLRLTARDKGRIVNTWTYKITHPVDYAKRIIPESNNDFTIANTINDKEIRYSTGTTVLTIDKVKGVITGIEVGGKRLPLTGGPRFTVGNFKVKDVKPSVNDEGAYTEFSFERSDNRRPMHSFIRIGLQQSGWISVEYSFDVSGSYPHVGVTFDFPEKYVQSIKWLGDGPYRVWKNRMKGVAFNIWNKKYNNTITGESWEYPEFKGFYSNLYAADLNTEYGTVKIVTATDNLFLHLFTPDNPVGRNNDNTLGVFPDGDLSILNAISPVGTKFRKADDTGPQGALNRVTGGSHTMPLSGRFYLKFVPR